MAEWGYDEHADWGTSNPSPRSRIFEDTKYLRLTEESEEYYEELKKSTKVKFIYFCGQFRQWDLALDALRENKSLTGCSIDAMLAANETLKAVAEYLSFSKVKKFGLDISPLEGEQIEDQLIEKVAKAIESNHYIEELTIRGDDPKVQLFEALKSHPTIKRLCVEVVIFSKPLIDIIARTINNSPNIKELSLSGIPEEYNFVQPLVDLTRVTDNLTRLEFLEGCFTGDQVIQLLKDLVQAESKLKGIHFDMCYVSGFEKEIGEFLAANLPLESFGLRLAGLGQNEDNIQYLIEGLVKNTHLTELDLRENSLDLGVLLPVLKNNRSITSFDFRGNKLKDFNLLAELNNNNTLRVFKTGLSRDEPLSLKPIWNSLKHNQSLTNINLAYGDNTYEQDFPASLVDVDNLKDMMETNRSITKLKLNEKIIAAVPELAELIQSFTERNKLEQRLNATNTLQTIAMISKSKSFVERLPKDIWRLIFSHIAIPGVVMDFASLF